MKNPSRITALFFILASMSFAQRYGAYDQAYYAPRRAVSDTTIIITVNGKDTTRTVSVERAASKALEMDVAEELSVSLRRMAKAQEQSLLIQKIYLGITIASILGTWIFLTSE